MRYPLPKDTARSLTAHPRLCRNLGLWLDRFLSVENDWQLPLDMKKRENAPLTFDRDSVTLINRCHQRQHQIWETYRAKGYTVSDFQAAPDYRLVIGFGADHVLETNLCLHRIYGFPIIPGSSIKGVTRAQAFWEIADKLEVPLVTIEEAALRKSETPLQILDQLLMAGTEPKQKKTLGRLQQDVWCRRVSLLQALNLAQWLTLAADFSQVFGTTEQQGQVIFYDAYPTRAPKLELDILNPHFGKYYRGEQPPADYLIPVPTYFLTVARDNPFQLAVASKDPRLATRAKGWLTGALTDLGIGGKTAAGYGFMRERS